MSLSKESMPGRDPTGAPDPDDLPAEQCLDGEWECGGSRHYTRRVMVPGLAGDPCSIDDEPVWYRRIIVLPEGSWDGATLVLNGARFAPRVHIDRELVSAASGGMAPTEHRLKSPRLRPGARIELEVELQPLDRLPVDDASVIPEADRWRSNVSACLWDSVRLRFHRSARLARVLPAYDRKHHRLKVRITVDHQGGAALPMTLRVWLEDARGARLANAGQEAGSTGEITLELDDSVMPWSPEKPCLHRLRVELWSEGSLSDRREMSVGLRDFAVEGREFRLNGEPVVLRAASVAWHRWMRDPEARELAFDTAWFERNVIRRLKDHGANTLRFHLGSPPEALLDLCDRHGLLVQAEWHFFHGLNASVASMVEQWRGWLDLCVRHPGTAIIHAWNETSPEELQLAWSALEQLEPEYAPLVVGHRDVIHLHKYWWSLFENLGLYYDSAGQFPLPIMADEFGGNYLDGQGMPGGYPMLKESFPRFLGAEPTPAERLEFQAMANGKVAEYWRRIGAAGFSPFCLLGSPEDGNHWFLGPLAEPREKPVWAALAAAWAPRSASLELWDRNFRPGQRLSAEVHCFNDTSEDACLGMQVMLLAGDGRELVGTKQELRVELRARDRGRVPVSLILPSEEGEWLVRVRLQAGAASERPVVSDWQVRTWLPRNPPTVTGGRIAVPEAETELREFLAGHGFLVVDPSDPESAVVVTGRATAERLESDQCLPAEVLAAVRTGRGWLALDLGPVPLGQGYGKDLGPLQAAPVVAAPATWVRRLNDIEVAFQEAPEPESHLHLVAEPAAWPDRPKALHWMWNGLRGGLVVPACTFEIMSVGRDSLTKLWEGRGADRSCLRGGPYYAYELGGSYAFSMRADDRAIREELRRRVRFLVEDAPSLAVSIDPEAPIQVTDLAAACNAAVDTGVRAKPLARCGKGLLRTPVWQLTKPGRAGPWILSQALTAGRLCKGYGEPGLFGRREDPAAGQFVLDLLARVLRETSKETAR